MAGKASVKNGKLGGRPKGRLNKKTIERQAAQDAYQQYVIKRLKPLFDAQYYLANGVSYLYRIDRHKNGSQERIEHVLLENPREIADALDTIRNHDPNGDENGNGFVYITTKPPSNQAIDSLLDRSIGKPKQSIDHTTLGEKLPVPVLGGASLP